MLCDTLQNHKFFLKIHKHNNKDICKINTFTIIAITTTYITLCFIRVILVTASITTFLCCHCNTIKNAVSLITLSMKVFWH